MSHEHEARTLTALGYLVLILAPGQVFGAIALPNAHTKRIARGWVALPSIASGYRREEEEAIAHDRGGSIYHLRDEDVME